MKPSVIERAAELRREIARHDRLYYVEARPEIGDADYDQLYRELEALERDHPEIRSPDSPTQRVGGAPVEGFARVHHKPPMMSLDKTHSRADLLDFDRFLRGKLGLTTLAYVVEPKIDGCAFSLRYEQGLLVRAATRGDGKEGDDITQNVRTIRSIPLRIATQAAVVEVRGEVYMSKEGFVRFTRQQEAAGKEAPMNPRNAAAGSLKLINPQEVATRPLDAVIYATGALDGIAFATHEELLNQLKSWGFRVPDFRCCDGIDAALEAVAALEKRRHDFPFEMDGAVIKANQRAYYDAPDVGATAKSPRWARAFKYEPERAETVLSKITVQVGRTGVLTPVAELEPVLLAGSTIARATLHNADEIARKDIRVGDHVWIVKAGDVIPAIESVVTAKRTGAEHPFVMPTTCPACGGSAERRADEVALRCVNPACAAQRAARLEHFAARNALDIEGLGGVVADALVAAGLVRAPLDLFELDFKTLAALNLGTPADVRRLGEPNAARIFEAVKRSRDKTLDRWIFAMGIPEVGQSAAQVLAGKHANLQALAESPLLADVIQANAALDAAQQANAQGQAAEFAAAAASIEACVSRLEQAGVAHFITPPSKRTGTRSTLTSLKFSSTIECAVAQAMRAFIHSDYGAAFLSRLRALGINPSSAAPAAPVAGPLTSQTFVITGVLSVARAAMAERIAQAGGKVAEAVTKSVTALVTGADPGATKVHKAQELGIRQLSEPELLALLESSPPAPLPPVVHQPELF